MPELPEVETIRRILNKQITGLTITAVNVHYSNTINKVCRDDFVGKVENSTIKCILRRGKYFIFNLTSGDMVLHLRLNGQLYVTDGDAPISKYALITFELSNGCVLHFDDKRKFATACLVPSWIEDRVSGVHRLGLDPFDDKLTAEYLKSKWKYRTCTIKEALLDQDVVAGYGNFYSDELLFVCGIYPAKRCTSLTDANYAALVRNIPDVMAWGLKADDITEEEYNARREGAFEAMKDSFVHGKSGEYCVFCKSKIQSMKLAGRTCCYCAICQPKVKVLNSEVTPEIFGVVASFVGSHIQMSGGFNTRVIPTINREAKVEDMTWEEFIEKVYEYLGREEPISIDHYTFDSERGVKLKIVDNINKESFAIGTKWIKTQNWKE